MLLIKPMALDTALWISVSLSVKGGLWTRWSFRHLAVFILLFLIIIFRHKRKYQCCRYSPKSLEYIGTEYRTVCSFSLKVRQYNETSCCSILVSFKFLFKCYHVHWVFLITAVRNTASSELPQYFIWSISMVLTTLGLS